MKTFSTLFVFIAGAAATAAWAAGGYHLLQKVSVPGDEGWDHPPWTLPAGDCMFRTAHMW